MAVAPLAARRIGREMAPAMIAAVEQPDRTIDRALEEIDADRNQQFAVVGNLARKVVIVFAADRWFARQDAGRCRQADVAHGRQAAEILNDRIGASATT